MTTTNIIERDISGDEPTETGMEVSSIKPKVKEGVKVKAKSPTTIITKKAEGESVTTESDDLKDVLSALTVTKRH
jgi:hypothetical protein